MRGGGKGNGKGNSKTSLGLPVEQSPNKRRKGGTSQAGGDLDRYHGDIQFYVVDGKDSKGKFVDKDFQGFVVTFKPCDKEWKSLYHFHLFLDILKKNDFYFGDIHWEKTIYTLHDEDGQRMMEGTWRIRVATANIAVQKWTVNHFRKLANHITEEILNHDKIYQYTLAVPANFLHRNKVWSELIGDRDTVAFARDIEPIGPNWGVDNPNKVGALFRLRAFTTWAAERLRVPVTEEARQPQDAPVDVDQNKDDEEDDSKDLLGTGKY